MGFKFVLLHTLLYPVRLVQNYKHKANILSRDTLEERFSAIYFANYWGNNESVSGYGSTLTYTQNLREQLPFLLKKFNINSIFDAPCGDFNWMNTFLKKNDTIYYIGGDIVKPMIDNLSGIHLNSRIKFMHIDLTLDDYPESELMLCRDCLFHLSFSDIKAVLNKFLLSKIKYLLTTSHENDGGFKNKDILSGDFRRIDLLSAPFNLPAPLYSIEDWMKPEHPRKMLLWSREQIKVSIENGF